MCREFDAGPGATVHFAYVKHAYRRVGIGRFLTFGAKKHSHFTKAGEAVAKRIGSLYDPYTLTQGS